MTMTRAAHHLFWADACGRPAHYALPSGPEEPPGLDLRQLCTAQPAFRQALALHAGRLPRPLTGLGSWPQALTRDELQRICTAALDWGVPALLHYMQEHAHAFAPLLTDPWQRIVARLATERPGRDALLLHAAQPDLYLWMPPALSAPRKLLICFGAAGPSLHASYPIAHRMLAGAGKGVGLLYVYREDRPAPLDALEAGGGLGGLLPLIGQIAARFGFQALYGLGTSQGGYTACHYAAALGLRRVLNFSGTPGLAGHTLSDQLPPDAWAPGYARSRILSVLSHVDAADRRLSLCYDAWGFETPRAWLHTPGTGSFTSAWLENRLSGLLDWLLADDEQPVAMSDGGIPPPSPVAKEDHGYA